MREVQNRVTLIVTHDLETDSYRLSIGQTGEKSSKRTRIAGPKYNNSLVEEILVEDIEVSKLLKLIKEHQEKREEYEYILDKPCIY